MSSIILLFIIAAAVYVLWFMKFTLPDGTEVKGWLNKYQEEKKGTHTVTPAQPANQPAETTSEEEFRLGSQSKLEDFKEALDIVFDNDAFSDESGTAMEEYVAWMLVAAGRIDDPVLNADTIWDHLVSAWGQNEDMYYIAFEEGEKNGDAEPWKKDKMPSWFVNANFLNGIAWFVHYASGHFEQATIDRINAMGKELNAARQGITEVNQEPCAGEYLARLYTILHDEDDSKIAENLKMFKEKYAVFFNLPEY